MLAAKLDLLLKKLDEGNQQQVPVPVDAMNSYLTCEDCGDGGHSGNDCPKTREDAAYINNNTGFRPQGGQGWGQARPPFQGGGNNFNSNFNSNQPSLRDLVFGQAKINESLNKKLATNDKILEGINPKVETLSSALKKQLSFNKMIETQLAQIAAVVPVSEYGKISGQGNPNLPLKLQIWCLPGGPTFPGRLLELTMQAGTIPQRMTLGMAW